jgi:hypothetical protein
MGKTKGPYNAEFAVGESVRIADLDTLRNFVRNWHYHHPLNRDQMAYANHVGKVKSVGFYHGGDELYQLKGIPGIWHEQCLLKFSEPRREA